MLGDLDEACRSLSPSWASSRTSTHRCVTRLRPTPAYRSPGASRRRPVSSPREHLVGAPGSWSARRLHGVATVATTESASAWPRRYGAVCAASPRWRHLREAVTLASAFRRLTSRSSRGFSSPRNCSLTASATRDASSRRRLGRARGDGRRRPRASRLQAGHPHPRARSRAAPRRRVPWPGSPPASGRSSTSSPTAPPTAALPRRSSSPRRPPASTSATCWPSSAYRTAALPRPSHGGTPTDDGALRASSLRRSLRPFRVGSADPERPRSQPMCG